VVLDLRRRERSPVPRRANTALSPARPTLNRPAVMLEEGAHGSDDVILGQVGSPPVHGRAPRVPLLGVSRFSACATCGSDRCATRGACRSSQAHASPAPAITHASPRPRRSAMSQGTEFHRVPHWRGPERGDAPRTQRKRLSPSRRTRRLGTVVTERDVPWNGVSCRATLIAVPSWGQAVQRLASVVEG
jgi:hypothetical protein